MPYIDLHCDTLTQASLLGRQTLSRLPDAAVDLERLLSSACRAQTFAVFLPPPAMLAHFFPRYAGDDAYILQCRTILMNTLRANPDTLAFAKSGADIAHNCAQGRISALLSLEDGRSVGGKLEKLWGYYDLGIRMVTLTWNASNCFGFPNSDDPEIMQQGLTDFGREAVAYMQNLHMLVDVSHLSDGGFRDVADICHGPFVASHSNCRSLCPHRRNLTDGMLRCLGNHGGVAGINCYPAFVGLAGGPAALARHARHMTNAGGMDVAALGADFDSFTGPACPGGPMELDLLWDALRTERFSEDEIEKLSWRNAQRVLQEAL